ncbi:MAG: type IV pilus secretin PilQ [Kofleriaceae bacterium]|nr:type IV pilus secretin PilQ [Kofleriaceae bacterium]
MMTISKYNTARLSASATLLLALLAFGEPTAHADKSAKAQKVSKSKMSIVGLASKTSGAKTTLRIRGESTPTFTVYKLENPSRVVVDIAGASLDSKLRQRDEKAVWNINSWAVGQVSAHNMGKTRSMVRVVVGLSRNSRYSVRAQGNDVLVEITAKEKPTSMSPQALQSARDAQARATLDAKAAKAAKAAADSARIRAQKEALVAQAQSRRDAKAAKIAMAEVKKARTQARIDANAARLAQQTATRAREQSRLDALAVRADATKRVALERAKVRREAETARVFAAKASAAERTRMRREARAAAEKEIADARAEAAKIRQEAIVSNRSAKERIAKAERLMAQAQQRSASAKKASRIAAAEIAKASKRKDSADVAERAAQSRQDELKKAERAATVALSKAKKARTNNTKNSSELQRKAEAAVEVAVTRRLSAERALRVAESRRVAAESATRTAGQKRHQAALALQEAEEQRAVAERKRDVALASRKSADVKRLHAQSTADKAASRARDLKTLIQAEEQRFEAARKLRRQEEFAVASATRARRNAESQGISARQAQETLKREVKKLALARKESRLRTVAAKTASKRANKAAKDGKTSASEQARLHKEAKRLALSGSQASKSLRVQEQKLVRQRQEVATLQSKKTVAARDLAGLEKKALLARELRAVEERKLSSLAAKRTQMRGQLDEARSIRLAAKRELEHARKARHDAEEARVLAQATATKVHAELEKAKLARMAAEQNRMETAREILRAKQHEEDAKIRFSTSMKTRALAENAKSSVVIAEARKHEREAKKALKLAKRERELAVKARLDGEKALKRANLREKQVSKQLAKANKKGIEIRTKAAVNTRLREIDVVERDNVTRLVIAMSAPSAPIVISNHGNEAILEIPMAGMRDDQERTLDTSRLGGAIRAVSSYRDPSKPGTIKVVVDLNGKSKGVLKKVGNTYYWEFPNRKATRTAAVKTKRRSKVVAYKAQSVAGYGSASSPVTQQTVAQVSRRRRKTYRGQKIDLDYKRSDIHDLMRLLAAVGGVNIIVPDDINAKVTIRLRRVPWDQALDVILASKGLGFKMEGPKLYRIATRKELDAEFEAKLARARARANSEAPTPEIFNLNYVNASTVQEQISPLLSSKGSVQVDVRTNALIINDVVANRARIVDLLTKLDTQTPQIQIEARIVEARSTFVRQFGIQWGGNMSASPAGGNATGLIFPSSIGLAGASDDGQTPNAGVSANPSNFAVNLPAAIGTGSGGGIGLSLGSVGGNLGLNLRLSALEDEGTVRIVSSPKITTSNNIQASIKSGVSIPISVVSANGVSTTFVPADLELKVTPRVSLRDCAISMDIEVKKNEADFANTGARGDPSLLTKEAKTTILVQDGDTSVIGGIYTRNSGSSSSKVPFFGDLPVIGWFFKSTRENDERTEVLIFITPKITNRAFLPCGE